MQFFGAARLVIVAGKGGVGKTTVTAVLAHAAAAAGLRVLAVELEGKPVLRDLLCASADDDEPSIDVITITAVEALADYLDLHGLKRVSKRLATSGVIDVVATAAPGIDDIVVLGKLKQLERSDDYDLIVVDGPAAGHAVTFLLAARGLMDTVRSGPIRTQAEDVLELFADPTRCQVILVTLPETTPINELIETAYAVEERVGVQLGPVIVNGVDVGDPIDISAAMDPLATEPGATGPASTRPVATRPVATRPVATTPGLTAEVIAAAEFRNYRRAAQRLELDRLSSNLALSQMVMPQLPVAGITAADVETLAVALLGQIGDLPG